MKMQVSPTLIDIAYDSGYVVRSIAETGNPPANRLFACHDVIGGAVVFQHYRTDRLLTHAKAKRLLETWAPGGLGESDCAGLEANIPHA